MFTAYEKERKDGIYVLLLKDMKDLFELDIEDDIKVEGIKQIDELIEKYLKGLALRIFNVDIREHIRQKLKLGKFRVKHHSSPDDVNRTIPIGEDNSSFFIPLFNAFGRIINLMQPITNDFIISVVYGNNSTGYGYLTRIFSTLRSIQEDTNNNLSEEDRSFLRFIYDDSEVQNVASIVLSYINQKLDIVKCADSIRNILNLVFLSSDYYELRKKEEETETLFDQSVFNEKGLNLLKGRLKEILISACVPKELYNSLIEDLCKLENLLSVISKDLPNNLEKYKGQGHLDYDSYGNDDLLKEIFDILNPLVQDNNNTLSEEQKVLLRSIYDESLINSLAYVIKNLIERKTSYTLWDNLIGDRLTSLFNRDYFEKGDIKSDIIDLDEYKDIEITPKECLNNDLVEILNLVNLSQEKTKHLIWLLYRLEYHLYRLIHGENGL